MLRLGLAALGATLGWWLGMLVGITLGGAIGFLASPLVGRALGGLLAGLIGGAIEARTLRTMKGKRLRFAAASALATALAAMLLLDVQVLPWLVGGLFGTMLGAAQAQATGLGRRDSLLRTAFGAVAWSLGFVVLHAGGSFGKLGVLAPAIAALLLALASANKPVTAYSSTSPQA
jgi:hypothetical protein